MPSLAISLAQSLAQSLANSIGDGTWEFSNFTVFANASERYVINPETGEVIGPFASGIPAVIWIDGKRFLQVEQSDTNNVLRSNNITQDTSYWSGGGTKQYDASALDPVGNLGCYKLITTTDVDTDYSRCHSWGSNSSPDGRNLSVFIKKGSQGEYCCLRFNVYPSSLNIDPPASDWMRYQFDAGSIQTSQPVVIYNDLNGDSGLAYLTTGDNIYIWCIQVGQLAYATSPILTDGSSVTRAKDQVYIPALSLPWFIKDKSKWLWYPEYSSDQVTTGDEREICEFIDTTQNIRCYYDGDDKKVKIAGTKQTFYTGSSPYQITQDATNIYVSDYDGKKVVKINKSDGTETTLASSVSNNPSGIAIDSTYVYFCEQGGSTIKRVPIAGGSVTVLASTGVSTPLACIVDDTNVYFCNYGNNKISSVPIAGGSVTDICSASAPLSLATDGTYLYFGSSSGLQKVTKTPNAPAVLDVTGTSCASYYDGYVYYQDASSNLKKISSSGGSPTTLDTGIAGYESWTDELYCYYNKGNDIYAVPIGGGTAFSLLTTSGGPRGLVSDDTRLYVCAWTDLKVFSIFKAPFSSAATTHSANQELEVTLDREAGSITLAGFTTGNGETVGTPWNRTDGDLKIAQDSSEANQIDGVIRLEKTT